jgi:hypothetical protein
MLSIALLLLLAANLHAQTPEPKRRVFVVHSGMHIILAPADKNHAARTLKEMLPARGIADRDVVALECPYPTASWQNVVPRDGLMLYLESTDPASRSAHLAYERLHRALLAQKVRPSDDLVWIGHSAGGQMGMTMAHLAHNLTKYPDLARKTQAYHFDSVITLGSAVGANPVPANVKLRHYFSSGDTMIYLLTKHGNLLAESVQSKVRFRPCCDMVPNVKVRVFPQMEHGAWYMDDDVLACIQREFEPNDCPPWRRTQADVGAGFGLAQLFAQALETQCRIALEDERPLSFAATRWYPCYRQNR